MQQQLSAKATRLKPRRLFNEADTSTAPESFRRSIQSEAIDPLAHPAERLLAARHSEAMSNLKKAYVNADEKQMLFLLIEMFDVTTIFTMFARENLTNFLEKTGKYILFPAALGLTVLQVAFDWHKFRLARNMSNEKGHDPKSLFTSRLFILALFNTFTALAITGAVGGSIGTTIKGLLDDKDTSTSLMVTTVAPAIFSSTLSLKSAFHFVNAFKYFWNYIRLSQANINIELRSRFPDAIFPEIPNSNDQALAEEIYTGKKTKLGHLWFGNLLGSLHLASIALPIYKVMLRKNLAFVPMGIVSASIATVTTALRLARSLWIHREQKVEPVRIIEESSAKPIVGNAINGELVPLLQRVPPAAKDRDRANVSKVPNAAAPAPGRMGLASQALSEFGVLGVHGVFASSGLDDDVPALGSAPAQVASNTR